MSILLQHPFRYALLSFCLSLLCIAAMLLFWPIFDTGFWLELALLVLTLLATFSLFIVGLVKTRSWWPKPLILLPFGLLGALLIALVVGASWMHEYGASIDLLSTKEDINNPQSPVLNLAYMTLASTNKQSASPIVYLAGGPGGSGVMTLLMTGRAPLFQAMRENADIIVYEQRGTMPWADYWLACPDTWQPSAFNEAFNPKRFITEKAQNIQTCAANFTQKGIQLTAYNTQNNAHDLEALRLQLGVDKLSLWATSYGTHLALTYIKQYPEHVDKVIMHGVEGLDDSLKTPVQIQQALEKIATLAAADETIGEQSRHLLDDIKSLLAQADAGELVIGYSHENKPYTLTVSKFELQLYLSHLLSSASSSATIPARIFAAKQGNISGFRDWAMRMRGQQRESLMSLYMDCASHASAERLALIAKQAPHTLLGNAINFPFPDICSTLNIPDLGDSFRAPVTSDVDILFISGDLDARTPISNAMNTAAGFLNAQHFIIHGAGHNNDIFLASGDILIAMQEFMKNKILTQNEATSPLFFTNLDAYYP